MTRRDRNSPEIGTDRRGDAVALGVEVVADVHRVTRFALVVVVVHRRLQEERVLTLGVAYFLYALIGRLDEHRLLSIHERPHPCVRRNLRPLHRRPLLPMKKTVNLCRKVEVHSKARTVQYVSK